MRIERAAPPTRTDALEAACRGVLLMLTSDRWPDQVAAWDGQRIRKVVRRARGAEWRRALGVGGVELAHARRRARV